MPSEIKSAKDCLISLICVIEKIIYKAHALQPESSNHLLQLEKARHSNRVPGNPKNILEIFFFLRTKKLVLRACESVASNGRRDSAQLSSALSQSHLFVTPWTAARQASLSITNSQNLLKFMSIELVMPSNHITLCLPLLLLPSIFLSIMVFSNESALHIRWPKY